MGGFANAKDCTPTVSPDGISGREWCYAEVSMSLEVIFDEQQPVTDPCSKQEQVASAASQKWNYCTPKTNYADVRHRVSNAFAEKANEIADAIAVVQSLSKETSRSRKIFFFVAAPVITFCVID